eukprot:14158400-Alexandrium_andersonii.AAC.1
MDDLNAGGPETSFGSYFAFVKSRFLLKVGGHEYPGSASVYLGRTTLRMEDAVYTTPGSHYTEDIVNTLK